MERCNFWKNKSKNLLCWQGLVLLDWSWQVRTCPNHDFWSNLTRFGFKIRFLTKFLNDSAWFLLEKLKKHIISTKNFTIWPNILKIKKNTSKRTPNQTQCSLSLIPLLLYFGFDFLCFVRLAKCSKCYILLASQSKKIKTKIQQQRYQRNRIKWTKKTPPTKHSVRFLWYLCCCILVLIFLLCEVSKM